MRSMERVGCLPWKSRHTNNCGLSAVTVDDLKVGNCKAAPVLNSQQAHALDIKKQSKPLRAKSPLR